LIPELRKHTRLWQQIEAYLKETETGRLPIADIPDLLDLDKSRRETYRNYVWALKNDTGKYKKLAELMHTNGDWLVLNTASNIEAIDMSLNGAHPDESIQDADETIQKEVIW